MYSLAYMHANNGSYMCFTTYRCSSLCSLYTIVLVWWLWPHCFNNSVYHFDRTACWSIVADHFDHIAHNHYNTTNHNSIAQLTTPTCGSSSPAPQWSLLPACIHDSIRVYLCPGSPHHPGAAHWSVVCHIQHQVPSSRCARQPHYWEEVVADLWGSEGVSDPGVPGAVLMCVQKLPLPTARRDSQCASNDRRHTREMVWTREGVHARMEIVACRLISCQIGGSKRTDFTA